MACSRTLSAIAMQCEPSKGGIVEAYVTPWQAGIFQYTVNTGSSTADVEIPELVTGVTSGLTWTKLAFRKNVSNFTSTMTIDETTGANFVSTVTNLVFGKMDTQSRIAISALAYSGVALVIKDANGRVWAMGLDEPVTLSNGTGETGTAATDANRYSVELTDISLFLPIEMDATTFASIAQ